MSPLKVIYHAFSNPATGSFAWIGAEEAELIFLNDFRWHPKMIAWADLLQALEGDTVHLPAPKNVCSRDIELCTSDAPLVLVKAASIDRVNTEMMNCRSVFSTSGIKYPKPNSRESFHARFVSPNLFCVIRVIKNSSVYIA